jgi:hypothetical protein
MAVLPQTATTISLDVRADGPHVVRRHSGGDGGCA